MKENLQKEVLKALNPLLSKGKENILKAGEFIEKESPELVKEIYRWGFLSSFLNHICYFFWFLFNILLTTCYFKLLYPNLCQNGLNGFFFTVLSVVLCLISVFWFFITLSEIINFEQDWIKILVAKRLYLIEFIYDLINNKKAEKGNSIVEKYLKLLDD